MIAALANLCALGIIWGVCFAFVMFLTTNVVAWRNGEKSTTGGGWRETNGNPMPSECNLFRCIEVEAGGTTVPEKPEFVFWWPSIKRWRPTAPID